jgi:hypothetical protein
MERCPAILCIKFTAHENHSNKDLRDQHGARSTGPPSRPFVFLLGLDMAEKNIAHSFYRPLLYSPHPHFCTRYFTVLLIGVFRLRFQQCHHKHKTQSDLLGHTKSSPSS